MEVLPFAVLVEAAPLTPLCIADDDDELAPTVIESDPKNEPVIKRFRSQPLGKYDVEVLYDGNTQAWVWL